MSAYLQEVENEMKRREEGGAYNGYYHVSRGIENLSGHELENLHRTLSREHEERKEQANAGGLSRAERWLRKMEQDDSRKARQELLQACAEYDEAECGYGEAENYHFSDESILTWDGRGWTA